MCTIGPFGNHGQPVTLLLDVGHSIRVGCLRETTCISLLYIPCMKYKYPTPWLCPDDDKREGLTPLKMLIILDELLLAPHWVFQRCYQGVSMSPSAPPFWVLPSSPHDSWWGMFWKGAPHEDLFAVILMNECCPSQFYAGSPFLLTLLFHVWAIGMWFWRVIYLTMDLFCHQMIKVS